MGFNALGFRQGIPMTHTQWYTESRRPQGTNSLFVFWQTLTHAQNPRVASPPDAAHSPEVGDVYSSHLPTTFFVLTTLTVGCESSPNTNGPERTNS